MPLLFFPQVFFSPTHPSACLLPSCPPSGPKFLQEPFGGPLQLSRRHLYRRSLPPHRRCTRLLPGVRWRRHTGRHSYAYLWRPRRSCLRIFPSLSAMSFLTVVSRLNNLLYSRDLARLAPQDRSLARAWMIQFMKSNHPDWDDKRIDREYESLLHCRPMAVDEWTRRLQG